MTTDDILRMAREAADKDKISPIAGQRGEEFITLTIEELERFAALVAAAQREECAKVCRRLSNYSNPMTANDCADPRTKWKGASSWGDKLRRLSQVEPPQQERYEREHRHFEALARPRISVDADALRQVLLALMGPGRLIREMQDTISTSDLTSGPHPIKVLLKDFHDATNSPAQGPVADRSDAVQQQATAQAVSGSDAKPADASQEPAGTDAGVEAAALGDAVRSGSTVLTADETVNHPRQARYDAFEWLRAEATKDGACEHAKVAFDEWARLASTPPAFMGVARRKLDDLLAAGWRVDGFSISRQTGDATERGGITTGGLVHWWTSAAAMEAYAARAVERERVIKHLPSDDTEGGCPA